MRVEARAERRRLFRSSRVRIEMAECLGIPKAHTSAIVDALTQTRIFPCSLQSNVKALGLDGALFLIPTAMPWIDSDHVVGSALLAASMPLRSEKGTGIDGSALTTFPQGRAICFGIDLAQTLVNVLTIAYFGREPIGPFPMSASLAWHGDGKRDEVVGTLEQLGAARRRVYSSGALPTALAADDTISSEELLCDLDLSQLVRFARLLDLATEGTAAGLGA